MRLAAAVLRAARMINRTGINKWPTLLNRRAFCINKSFLICNKVCEPYGIFWSICFNILLIGHALLVGWAASTHTQTIRLFNVVIKGSWCVTARLRLIIHAIGYRANHSCPPLNLMRPQFIRNATTAYL